MHCLYFICERTHARKNYATLEINPMENVNKQRRNFISLSELWYDPLEFNFRRVRLTDKVGGRKNREKDWKNANSLFPQIVDVLLPTRLWTLKSLLLNTRPYSLYNFNRPENYLHVNNKMSASPKTSVSLVLKRYRPTKMKFEGLLDWKGFKNHNCNPFKTSSLYILDFSNICYQMLFIIFFDVLTVMP